jgi:thiaminase/transcriptional activator TenA
MSFSSDAWAKNQARYETIRTMPFNQELANGTLSRERFQHYMIQDAHYLIAFGRALAVAAAKSSDADGLVQFSHAAEVAVIVERSLHTDFMQQFGVSPDTFAATPLSPACDHYTSYLLATAWSASYPVALAALLPCFWIYAEIGRDIHGRAVHPNPYNAWIETYAGEDFHAAVRGVIETVDRVAADVNAATLREMHKAFTRATQLEWIFWNSAYQLEQWPL